MVNACPSPAISESGSQGPLFPFCGLDQAPGELIEVLHGGLGELNLFSPSILSIR